MLKSAGVGEERLVCVPKPMMKVTDMSDDSTVKAELVDYYCEWGPAHFRKSNGQPLGKRALQQKAKQFGLPLISTGWGALIDPVAGEDQLRQFAKPPSDRARRGRK
jgi:hypothetical protein